MPNIFCPSCGQFIGWDVVAAILSGLAEFIPANLLCDECLDIEYRIGDGSPG